jgi:lipoprotein-releasing system permease protein
VYKYLLCWRYLLTRYLALACIISVMLGVATLIVVNSVMSGFSTKLKDRLHGLLSDVLLEARNGGEFLNPEEKMEAIRKSPVGNEIEAMTPVLEVFAMLQFPTTAGMSAKPVRLIGVDPEGRAKVGGFAEHLVFQKGSAQPSFTLNAEAKARHDQRERQQRILDMQRNSDFQPGADGLPPPAPPPTGLKDPEGVIIGYAIANFHYRDPNAPPDQQTKEFRALSPGDDVILTTISGQKLVPVYDRFTICDYFKSEMSEYDANYVFVPLKYLQELRATPDQVSGIQIRLKNYRKAKQVTEALAKMFPGETGYKVETWEDKQGPLLAAIRVERGLLNVLLFMIVGVAGFGILAIFTMIVVEKTKDIGILKALGASNTGVMKIFLGYGLLLGLVGDLLGTVLGLAFTERINEIEKLLAKITGQDIFPRDIYYFDRIPTDIQTWSVLFVNFGAVAIAVLFSILPALHAARLQPVKALRYE